jgi:hypothetical protein
MSEQSKGNPNDQQGTVPSAAADRELFPLEPLCSCPTVSNSSKSEYYQPPRLGIIHFLAWMTFAAVLLVMDSALKSFSMRPLSQYDTAIRICRASVDIILAALLVGGGVFLIDCFRRKAGAFQPGHWILSISAIQFFGEWIIFNMYCWGHYGTFSYPTLFNPNRTNLSLIWVVLLFSIALLYRWGSRKLTERWPWKWILYLLSVRCLSDSVLMLFYWSGLFVFFPQWIFIVYFLYFPIVGLLIIATKCDFCKGLRCDWWHWLGIIALLALMILFDIILGAGLGIVRFS